MSDSTHFDQRGSTYDTNETHRRIIATLVSGAPLRAGMRVLDIATGTGGAALKAAEVIGTHGSVLGIDVSDGMLTEARRKVSETGLQNVEFVNADAERINLSQGSFDLIFCASGVVMMRDIPGALCRWASWLRPEGYIAFDMPGKPFGLSQEIAKAAARHGVTLPYDVVADTPAKCRALLEHAGFNTLAVVTDVVSDDDVPMAEAIAFFETRQDHPAWRILKEAPKGTRDVIRVAYIERLSEIAIEGRVKSKVEQLNVYGQRRKA